MKRGEINFAAGKVNASGLQKIEAALLLHLGI